MVPVSLLQSGYRHVMLEPPSGSLYNVPSLFLLIKTKEAKPLSLRQLSRRLSDARSVGFLRIYSVPGEIDSLILGVTERTTTADVIGMALQKTGLEYECGQFALAEVYDDQGERYLEEEECPLLVQHSWKEPVNHARLHLRRRGAGAHECHVPEKALVRVYFSDMVKSKQNYTTLCVNNTTTARQLVELALDKICYTRPLVHLSSEDTDDDVLTSTDARSDGIQDKSLTDFTDYVLIEKQVSGSQVVEERCVMDSEMVLQVQGCWTSGHRFYVRHKGFRSPKSPLNRTIWYDSMECKNEGDPDYVVVPRQISASGSEENRCQRHTYAGGLPSSPIPHLTNEEAHSLPDSFPSQNATNCWPDSVVVKASGSRQQIDSHFGSPQHQKGKRRTSTRHALKNLVVRLRKNRIVSSNREAVNKSTIYVGRSTFHFSTEFMEENSFSDSQLGNQEVGSNGKSLSTVSDPIVRSRLRSASLPAVVPRRKRDSDVNVRVVRQDSCTTEQTTEEEMQREINCRSEELARMYKKSSQQSELFLSESDSSSLENLDAAANEEFCVSTDFSLKQELLMLEKQLYTEQRLCNGAMRMAGLETHDQQALRKLKEMLEQSRQYMILLQNRIDHVKAKLQRKELDSNSSQP